MVLNAKSKEDFTMKISPYLIISKRNLKIRSVSDDDLQAYVGKINHHEDISNILFLTRLKAPFPVFVNYEEFTEKESDLEIYHDTLWRVITIKPSFSNPQIIEVTADWVLPDSHVTSPSFMSTMNIKGIASLQDLQKIMGTSEIKAGNGFNMLDSLTGYYNAIGLPAFPKNLSKLISEID